MVALLRSMCRSGHWQAKTRLPGGGNGHSQYCWRHWLRLPLPPKGGGSPRKHLSAGSRSALRRHTRHRGVQLRVGHLLADGAGGGVPPARRDHARALLVDDVIAADAAAEHWDLPGGVVQSAVDRVLVRVLDPQPQDRVSHPPHRAHGLRGGGRRIDRRHRLPTRTGPAQLGAGVRASDREHRPS